MRKMVIGLHNRYQIGVPYHYLTDHEKLFFRLLVFFNGLYAFKKPTFAVKNDFLLPNLRKSEF